MTTTGASPAMDLSLRRRSLLLGALGGAAALTVLGTGTAASAATVAPPTSFDFDNGNFIRDLLAGQDPRGTLDVIGPMDATIVMWSSHMVQTAWFDAIAPYHPTALGLYSRIPRRPSSEATTNRNKNIAALTAMCRVLEGVVPERTTGQNGVPNFRDLLTAIGMDPNDHSLDPTTPVGIGNLAGRGVVKWAQTDGMNLLGMQGRKYNPIPFHDYTNYQPVNDAFKLTHPSRWQPQLTPHHRRLGTLITGEGDKGIFVIQQFVTPQLARVKPVTYRDPAQFHIQPPDHTDFHQPRKYKASVDEMLAASANLTEEQKIKAEIFDNKELGLSVAVFNIANKHDAELTLDDWVHLFFTTVTANIDALIAAWYQKTKYDAVRPVSAIHYVYGNRKVTSWGGPNKGTVHDMPAQEWAAYLNVADHPEYPSGSTCLCSAEAQAVRRFFNSDELDLTIPIPAAWSIVEPGLPTQATSAHWDNLTDFVKDCAYSRVWGGVHFRKTIERSIGFGQQFGDRSYEFVQRQIRGDVHH